MHTACVGVAHKRNLNENMFSNPFLQPCLNILHIEIPLKMESTKPAIWCPKTAVTLEMRDISPLYFFKNNPSPRTNAARIALIRHPPARKRTCEFLFSGTLSERSHGCIPRKLMMLPTASAQWKKKHTHESRNPGCPLLHKPSAV